MVTTSYHQWSSATWLAVAGGLLLCVSVALSVWTVLPRLRGTPEKGFIYWGSIAAHCSVDQLQKSFHSQTPHELNDYLLRHIFVLSTRVCIPKYRAVSLCILALALGGFLAISALMLQDAHA
jgi:Family of unknown function (DUF5706)